MAPRMPSRPKTLDEMKSTSAKPLSTLTVDEAVEQFPNSGSGEQTQENSEEKVLVEVLNEGHFYNNHPLPVNSVIELPVSEIDLLRERGYCLGPVADDYDGDVYDWTPEWQHPDNEKAA